MYINFEVLKKHGLSPNDLITLLAIKQKEDEELICSLNPSSDEDGELVLVKEGFIEKMKKVGFKVTKKATTLLRDIEIAEVTDSSKEGYASLIKLYESVGRKDKVGNKKRGLRYFSTFLATTDFPSDKIYEAVNEYLNDNEHQYTRKLDELVYKPSNVYATKFKLEDSKLYTIVNNY